MIIQIYEIQTPEEAEALIVMGVDHIGSVLTTEDGWRDPAVKAAVEASRGRARHSIIPLFNTPDTIFRVLDHYRPDIVHFCEALADERGIFPACDGLIRLQEGIRERFPCIDIMRAIPIGPAGRGEAVPSLGLAEMFAPASDLFLTDTMMLPASTAGAADDQPVKGFVGITGRTCDWEIARALVAASPIPVILAGGLSPENVRNAILATRPAGVDSCTGTNARDPAGIPIRFSKDMARVRRFIEEARRADAAEPAC
jgi:phosphoribosylanthranilate isomerase